MAQSLALVEQAEFSREANEAFIQYASYDNARSIPDVRDGLRLGARRIIWGMNEVDARVGKRMVKGVVAAAAGLNYHPHGDSAAYTTIVTMAHEPEDGKPVKMLVPIVHGQGSWGDLDFGAASARYTDCQINRYGMTLLGSLAGSIIEIQEDAVPMYLNYTGEQYEPEVMPALAPNFVINGAFGAIGTGISSQSAPHNPIEALKLAVKFIEAPTYLSGELTDKRMETIRSIMPGPDFPADCDIFDNGGIESYYKTGHGGVVMRARYEIGTQKIGRKTETTITFTGFPYRISPTMVLEGLVELRDLGRIPDHVVGVDITSRDNGPRVLMSIGESDPDEILNALFFFGEKSGLQTSYAVYSRAIVNGKIRSIGTIEAIGEWIDHRRTVVRNRSKYRLNKAKSRLEIVLGYLQAAPIAHELVDLIRASDDRPAAGKAMQARWGFTERQTHAILDMTIGQITKLGIEKYADERDTLEALIADCERLLKDDAFRDERIIQEIKTVIKELSNTYDLSRRCSINGSVPVTTRPEEKAPPAVPGVYITTPGGWVRWAKTRGVSKIVGSEYVTRTESIDNRQFVDAVSDFGWQYRVLADELPEKMAKLGSMFSGSLDAGESLIWNEVVQNQHEGRGEAPRSLIVFTSLGRVKRIDPDVWDNLRVGRTNRNAKSIIRLEDGETVIHSFSIDPNSQDIGVLTAYGKFLRFDPLTLSPKGRAAAGIPGVKLEPQPNDTIVWAGPWGGTQMIYWTDNGLVGRLLSESTSVAGRNTKGSTVVDSSSIISGAVVGSDSANALRYFLPDADEPTLLTFDDLDARPKFTDRTLKVQDKALLRSKSIWLDSVEKE